MQCGNLHLFIKLLGSLFLLKIPGGHPEAIEVFTEIRLGKIVGVVLKREEKTRGRNEDFVIMDSQLVKLPCVET